MSFEKVKNKFLNLLKFLILFVFISLVPENGFSALNVGVGYSSTTSGQAVPSLVLQYDASSWCMDLTTTGYASQNDYFSGYTMGLYWPTQMGTLWGMNLEVGIGAGIFSTQRAFRDSTSSSISPKSDYGFGPNFFASWHLTNWMFIRMQSLLGVGSANNLALFFQDVSHLSVGFSW